LILVVGHEDGLLRVINNLDTSEKTEFEVYKGSIVRLEAYSLGVILGTSDSKIYLLDFTFK
jgi:hypothetical protein